MYSITTDQFRAFAATARDEMEATFLVARDRFPAFAYLTFPTADPMLLQIGPDPRIADLDVLVTRLIPSAVERQRENVELPLPSSVHVGFYDDDRFWAISVSRAFSEIQKSVVVIRADGGPLTHDFEPVLLTHKVARALLPLKDLLYDRHPLSPLPQEGR